MLISPVLGKGTCALIPGHIGAGQIGKIGVTMTTGREMFSEPATMPDEELLLLDLLNVVASGDQLAEFCRYIGLQVVPLDGSIGEAIWRAFLGHFTGEDGALDAARACRAFLEYPPIAGLVDNMMSAPAS